MEAGFDRRQTGYSKVQMSTFLTKQTVPVHFKRHLLTVLQFEMCLSNLLFPGFHTFKCVCGIFYHVLKNPVKMTRISNLNLFCLCRAL